MQLGIGLVAVGGVGVLLCCEWNGFHACFSGCTSLRADMQKPQTRGWYYFSKRTKYERLMAKSKWLEDGCIYAHYMYRSFLEYIDIHSIYKMYKKVKQTIRISLLSSLILFSVIFSFGFGLQPFLLLQVSSYTDHPCMVSNSTSTSKGPRKKLSFTFSYKDPFGIVFSSWILFSISDNMTFIQIFCGTLFPKVIFEKESPIYPF